MSYHGRGCNSSGAGTGRSRTGPPQAHARPRRNRRKLKPEKELHLKSVPFSRPPGTPPRRRETNRLPTTRQGADQDRATRSFLCKALQAPRRRHAGAVPDARKNRLKGRKSPQENGQRPPYHSPGAGWVGVVAPLAASRVRGERTRAAIVWPSIEEEGPHVTGLVAHRQYPWLGPSARRSGGGRRWAVRPEYPSSGGMSN